jgi:hypothetical protein
MEDFMKNKINGLKNIYNLFGLNGFSKVLPAFTSYLAQHPVAPHETTKIHADTIRFVNEYASNYVIRLGYQLRHS